MYKYAALVPQTRVPNEGNKLKTTPLLLHLSPTHLHSRCKVSKTLFGLHCDSDIWWCKGRLSNDDLDVCVKHPILLPSSHFIILVIQHSHEKALHGGMKETLTELRSRERHCEEISSQMCDLQED